ncbi:hypothetical protein V1509DRAFT_572917, partial [Lipomyces kononenkoae]
FTNSYCQKWSFTDSARSTSTTGMSYHLQKIHGLPLCNDKEYVTQPRITTTWKIIRKESHKLGLVDKTAVYCN